jgi:hypothetical protein
MMKKLSLALVVLVFSASLVWADNWTENFDSGLASSYTTGIQTLGTGDWYTSDVYQETSGNSYGGAGHAARLNDDTGGASLRTPGLNTIGTVTFYYRELNSGGGTFSVEKSYDNSSWTEITTQSFSGTTFTQFTYDVNDNASTVYIRVVSDNQSGHLIIDEFSVTDYSTSSGPQAPTNISIDYITVDKMQVSWTKPSGTYDTDWDGVWVIVSQNDYVDNLPLQSPPLRVEYGDGIDLTGNTIYGSGTEVEDQDGVGGYCVANHTTDADGDITVTGISGDESNYYVMAFAYKTVTGDNNDDEFSDPATGDNAVQDVQPVTDLSANVGDGEVTLNWTNPPGTVTEFWDKVVVVTREGAAVEAIKNDFINADVTGDVAFNADWSARSNTNDLYEIFGNSYVSDNENYTVYNGTTETATVTGLTNGNEYHFKAFVFYEGPGGGGRSVDEYWSYGTSVTATPADVPQPNDVIINEYDGDANPEWIELLVVKNGVDLRNWILTDEEPDAMNSPGEGVIAFADELVFSNVPMGTYIVIIDDTGTDDADYSDKSMTLYTENSLLNETNDLGLSNSGDNITIWYDDDGTWDATNSIGIDHISYINYVAPPTGVTWASEIPSARGADDGVDAYFSDGANFNNDDAVNWVKSETHTQGFVNVGQDDSALPVELGDFRAEVEKDGIRLLWTTESEIHNKGFYVYRSTDDKTYSKISGLIPGNGTTSETSTYSFMDKNVKYGQVYYYKISDVEEITLKETYHGPLAVIAGKGQTNPESPELPRSFELSQNMPNPFNPTTTITYDLPTKTYVSLKIYDANGRLVKTLMDRDLDAGYYSVNWNGTDNTGKTVNSGVYIYRLETDKEVESKSMILMK